MSAIAERPVDDRTTTDDSRQREYRDALTALSELYDATDPDLSSFASDGGRLIIYQGWADQAIPPFGTLAYYNAVVDAAVQAMGQGDVQQVTQTAEPADEAGGGGASGRDDRDMAVAVGAGNLRGGGDEAGNTSLSARYAAALAAGGSKRGSRP